jgi:RNA polymerase sigma-70 factor, ECF subfamily
MLGRGEGPAHSLMVPRARGGLPMFGRRRAREGGMEVALGHMDTLYGVALTLTQDANDAVELVHETYLRGYRSVRRLTDSHACKEVLYKIMLRLWPKTRWRAPHEVGLPDRPDDPAWERSGSGRGGLCGGDNPEAAARQNLFVAAVDRALAKLPPELRAVVLLAELEGYTYREMADLLGWPQDLVRTRLHRARHWLAQELATYTEPMEEGGAPA